MEPSGPVANEAWTEVLTLGDESTLMVGGPITYGTAGFLMVSDLWDRSGDSGPGRRHQSMWLSADGSAWDELDMPAQSSGFSVAQLITASDGSYVAYGSQSIRGEVGAESIALRSTDGRSWQEVESGLPRVIDYQAIELGPAGYLLVGGQTAETNPTLWLSADGLAWELVHEFAQTRRWIKIHDADGGADGYVVLGLRIEPESGDYQRFAFASADGRDWFNRDEPLGPDDQRYLFDANVSSLGRDWVATLGHHDAPITSWFSANGLDWSEAGSLAAAPSTGAGLLEEVGEQLVFSPGSGYYEGTAGVWSSTDGANGAVEDFGTEVWLGGIAQGDGVIAATGTVPGTNGASTGGVWVKASD